MGSYREIQGDLIELAKDGRFDVIAHGCNCFCTQQAGIAKQLSAEWETNTFKLEHEAFRGDFSKLGNIDYRIIGREPLGDGECVLLADGFTLRTAREKYKHSRFFFALVNAYTQYNYGRNHSDGAEKPINYAALELCLSKINHEFKGKRIGLPQIGCGLAGGDWTIVSSMIQANLHECDVTVVIYKK